MQEEINHQQTRACYFSRLAYDLLDFQERLSHWKISWLNDEHHRIEFQQYIDEFQQIEQRFQQYQIIYPDGPFKLNIDEYLRSSRIVLEQLTTK